MKKQDTSRWQCKSTNKTKTIAGSDAQEKPPYTKS